jgi:hypothetical protein
LACLSSQIDLQGGKKNITEGKEVDLFTAELSTAFDIPSLVLQRVRLETMRAGCIISTAEAALHFCSN